jgi:hypothetical protein
VSDSPSWTQLFLARWPDGTVTLISGTSMEHIVDQLDAIGDAATCEVVSFERNLWLTFRPNEVPANGLIALVHDPVSEVDSQADILELSFPVLHRVGNASTIEHDDGDLERVPIDSEAWNQAVPIERDRILSPSLEWRASIEAWWASFAPDRER